jgi:hypothetical protein
MGPALAAPAVIEAWERGRHGRGPDRGLAVLAAACPERRPDELAALPVGRRDGLLLEIRAATFGPLLDGQVACPGCGATVGFTVPVEALRLEPAASEGGLECEVAGVRLRLRLPSSLDLAAAAAADREAAHRRLLAACVLEARDGAGRPVAADNLPAAAAAAIAARLGEADPQADLTFRLACPDCGREAEAALDVGEFLWAEVAGLARRLLAEVHSLAGAYGWREADILALSPARRQAYLEMAG